MIPDAPDTTAGDMTARRYGAHAERRGDPPFWFDVCTRADVVLGCEHKLVVEHPLRLVIQDGGGVQLHHLVVLHCQVVARALQVSDLSRWGEREDIEGSGHTSPPAAQNMR